MFKYLRLSITDRCNFRCIYCMPEEGICKQAHSDILRFEEILPVVHAAVATGIEQVRITGGEPLIRKGVVEFIKQLSGIRGLNDLCLTTNAYNLSELAVALKAAGLNRINVSLDSLEPETFRKITRVGTLKPVLDGIHAAIAAGLDPVKLNVVIIPGINDGEIENFVRFASENPVHVRFIERMPFPGARDQSGFISETEVFDRIAGKFSLTEVTEKKSFGPARLYKIVDGKGYVGFISPRTQPFCISCRRLRLTANGYLLPCLDSSLGVRVRGMPEEEIKQVIAELYAKKDSWQKNQACFNATFDSSLSKIGG